MDPRPSLIAFAHRGARAERRENTLSAFERALELGANGLESDAWLTSDGQVVLDHDGATGPPWRRRRIAGQARKELPRHIPALSDLYAACGVDYELSLDLKDPAALGTILAAASAAGALATARLWICHHDPAQLLPREPAVTAAHLVQSTRLARIPEGVNARSEGLAAHGVRALNLPGSEWTPSSVAGAHAAGVLAFGWGAQSRPAIRRLLDMGVDGIYSDHVRRLVDEVTRAGRSSEAERSESEGSRESERSRESEAAETRQWPDHHEGPPHE